MQVRNRHIIVFIFLFLVFFSGVVAFLYQYWFMRPYQGKKTISIRLYKSSSIDALITEFNQKKLLPRELNGFLRLSMTSKKWNAGEYELKRGMALLDLLKQILMGRVKVQQFAIIPGWTVAFLLERVSQELAFEPQALSIQSVVGALGINHQNPEGLFYPANYPYYWGSSGLVVLKNSYEKMQAILTKEWENRATELPFKNAYEALIVASLIEKETHAKEERSLIARVIINRLNKGMRLQIDPTVIYASKNPDIRYVTLQLLKLDSPYNTYRYNGLPPTPICLPGMDSIHAALHPAKSDVLFYVALGDGIHHRFSSHWDQHLAYVKDYREKLAQQRKNTLLSFPITLNQFKEYWKSHCAEIYYWLPFVAGLVTLPEETGDWVLFPVEKYQACSAGISEKQKKSIYHE
jgi:UPF0755 protein